VPGHRYSTILFSASSEELRVVLWWFSCRNGHELVDGKSAAHFHFREVAVQPAGDAGVVTADEEDPVALQFQVGCSGLWPAALRGR